MEIPSLLRISTEHRTKCICWISSTEFVTGSYSMDINSLILWNFEKEVSKKFKIKHNGDCTHIKFIQNLLFTTSSNGLFSCFKDFKLEREIKIFEGGNCTWFDYSEENKTFYISSENGKVISIDFEFKEKKEVISENSPIHFIQLRKDLLCTCSRNIKIWNLKDFKTPISSINNSTDSIYLSFHFHPKQFKFITSTNDGRIGIWDFKNSPFLLKEFQLDTPILKVEFSSEKIYFSSENGSLFSMDDNYKVSNLIQCNSSINSFEIVKEMISLVTDHGQILIIKF